MGLFLIYEVAILQLSFCAVWGDASESHESFVHLETQTPPSSEMEGEAIYQVQRKGYDAS